LHSIIIACWFGPKGIAHHFPHKFKGIFPTPSMALTSALSEIVLLSFDPKTGAYKLVTLNDEHVKIYGQYAKQCVDMLENDYHSDTDLKGGPASISCLFFSSDCNCCAENCATLQPASTTSTTSTTTARVPPALIIIIIC